MAQLQFSNKAARSLNAKPPRPKQQGNGAQGGLFAKFGSLGGVFHGINIPLLLVLVALLSLGLVTLYAVTLTDKDYSIAKQAMGVGLGLVACIVIWLFDYRRLNGIPVIAALMAIDLFVILLPLTPLGTEVNGARSWIRLGGSLTLQPSELAKPVTILMMAAYVSRFGGSIRNGKDYLKCVGLMLVPMALLAKEDLGTSLVLMIICFVVMFVGGASGRWVLVTIMVGVVGVAGILVANNAVSEWSGGQTQIIKQYQMSRLLVFIDQDNPDYADDAYNLKQANIAVGSGKITGKGWGNATQSSGGFLPESATDFIFCVYAEQFGFVGSVVLLLLYLALLACAMAIGFASSDVHGSLICAGVAGMWTFQILENIGMDIGLMPITGIPLPFMSYGSSFMVINFICVGLLMSVWVRRA